MTLEDMSINEVLVRYLRNMAEIERLKAEDLQISTTTDSIEEPRYVEDLSQWEEYRATKEEITRLSEERKANINERRQTLSIEQRDIRAFLLHNESVPKNKWIRCADEGVYVPGDPANGEPAVRVASWEHIMETNGEPERLDEIRREKESTFWGRLESVRRDPRRKPVALAALATLILLTLLAGSNGFTFGVIILGALATWWFLETRKQLREARGLLHETGTSEQLRVAQPATGKSWTNLLRIVVAILLPPLSVLSQVGLRKHFWINILLTIFGYIPGIIHAVWVIAKYQYASNKSTHALKPSGTVELTRQLSSVRYMSGTQFEMLVANVLRRLGYQTTVLGGSGDQGVDVIARAGNEKIAIQCKNYAKPIGNRPVQEVYAGARHHGCTAAWVVAPEGFTKGAVALARSVGVLLHDAQSLQTWIRQIDQRERKLANVEPRTVDLDTLEPRVIDLDESEATVENGMEKQTVYVGSEGSTVGETVAFTANLLV